MRNGACDCAKSTTTGKKKPLVLVNLDLESLDKAYILGAKHLYFLVFF